MPSAFILVLVEVLVMPEGVVIVLDFFIVAPPFVMVDDLVIPAGLLIVLDFVVTRAPGWVILLVVIFDELVLIVAAGAGVAGGVVAGVWARATELPRRLKETRKPKIRFITNWELVGENMGLLRGFGRRSWASI